MRFLFLLLFSISFLFGTLVSFSYDERDDLQVLNELDIEIEFIKDPELQELYTKYSSESKNYFIDKFNQSISIIPTLKEVLKKEKVPSTMLYLGMAESNFNISAKSNMKAKGLWQFIPDTARRYGLQNDQYLDERLDLEKSTIAAAKYLKNLHNIFGKWYLTAIAYNCGEGRLIEGIVRVSLDLHCKDNPEFCNTNQYKEYRKVISDYQNKKTGFSELNRIYKEIKELNIPFTLSDLSTVQENESRQYIPLESRNHIKKIVSFAIMMNKNFVLTQENTHLLNRGVHKVIVPVSAKGGLHLRSIAEITNVDYDELVFLNSHLKQQIIPLYKKNYQIYIPYQALNTYQQNIDNIPQVEYQIHIVKSGDNLGRISKKYGISHNTIKDFNQLSSDMLKLKQKLIIPIPKKPSTKKQNIVITQSSGKKFEYIVQKGDTLGTIAKTQKIDLNKLISDNKLKSTTIFEGDKLVISY